VREIAPKAFAAIGELCGGTDQIIDGLEWGNGFIANYGFGRDKEWIAPSPAVGGWHVDGNFFLHFLDSPEQGLLTVVLYSDIHPKGGGTFILCDSIATVARHLAAHPEGVLPGGFPWKDILYSGTDFRETTGQAGDVYLIHPFMLHTSSYNHRPEARIMTNPTVILRDPMRFDRRSDGSAYTPVEKAILNALGVEYLEFKPTSPRRRIPVGGANRQKEMQAKEREQQAELKA
jgi:hypothetical protein